MLFDKLLATIKKASAQSYTCLVISHNKPTYYERDMKADISTLKSLLISNYTYLYQRT